MQRYDVFHYRFRAIGRTLERWRIADGRITKNGDCRVKTLIKSLKIVAALGHKRQTATTHFIRNDS